MMVKGSLRLSGNWNTVLKKRRKKSRYHGRDRNRLRRRAREVVVVDGDARSTFVEMMEVCRNLDRRQRAVGTV